MAPTYQQLSYVVKSGDTLTRISVRYYGSSADMSAIMKANDLASPDKIYIGQKLMLPVTANGPKDG